MPMNRPDTETSDTAADPELDRLAELVVARMGLHFPASRRKDLLRAAEALAREAGRSDTGAYLKSLIAGPLTDRQTEILTSHLTVVETYFFREMKSLDAFRDHVIPELLRQRAGVDQRLRIWSAGCSTGEEAYSIAMLLTDLIPDPGPWDLHILATDINARALEKAREGVYTEWSFRGMPDPLRERYFKPHGSKAFAVKPRFKSEVSFVALNLATDTYPSLLNDTNAMDVIFCRNVLMYLAPEQVQKIVSSFHHCLVEGGWLIVSPSETSLLHGSGFAAVSFDGATLYRKAKPRQAAAAIRPPPGPAPSSRIHAEVVRTAVVPDLQPDPYEGALAAYHAGRYDAASAFLKPLLTPGAGRECGPSANALALMARIEANQGKLNQAEDWAQKAISANKLNPGYYYLLATIQEEQQRPAEAVQALNRALYLDSSFILAHYTLGTIALREHGHKAADRHFLNAASLLAQRPKTEVLPEAEGVTAGRLLEIVQTFTGTEDRRP
jgi:chemotaxis protein methyltransferase CheR